MNQIKIDGRTYTISSSEPASYTPRIVHYAPRRDQSHWIVRFQILGSILAVVLGALGGVGLAIELAAHAPDEYKVLPHRPVDELTNWGQGRAPAGNLCPPGTIRFETDEGLFLECYRTQGVN